jgi:hypothetical protein
MLTERSCTSEVPVTGERFGFIQYKGVGSCFGDCSCSNTNSGALWAIDNQGTPHFYDPITNGDPRESAQIRVRRGNEGLNLAFGGQEFQIVEGPSPLPSWQASIDEFHETAFSQTLTVDQVSAVLASTNKTLILWHKEKI